MSGPSRDSPWAKPAIEGSLVCCQTVRRQYRFALVDACSRWTAAGARTAISPCRTSNERRALGGSQSSKPGGSRRARESPAGLPRTRIQLATRRRTVLSCMSAIAYVVIFAVGDSGKGRARRCVFRLKSMSLEAVKPSEIPILGNQPGHAGLAAQSNDLRIENEIPDGIRLTNSFMKM